MKFNEDGTVLYTVEEHEEAQRAKACISKLKTSIGNNTTNFVQTNTAGGK